MEIYSQQQLFEAIEQVCRERLSSNNKPLRVAINGIEGTGKTYLAEKFSAYLNQQALEAHHITIDGFHNDTSIRYRQGRDSAKGYYEDSFDELAFVEKVLLASQQDPTQITKATHDLETDKYVTLEPININSDSVIVTDGAYLFKPNYLPHWDLKIYLQCPFYMAMARGIKRDEASLGGLKEAEQKFIDRYHTASKMYNELNQPEKHADIIIDNSNFSQLRILKGC